MNYASIYAQSARSGLVRLRTLIILRWLAVIGQVTAILISKFIIGLQIDLKLCILAIVASVFINLFPRSNPENIISPSGSATMI